MKKIMTQHIPKNKAAMWFLLAITVLLGGFSLITASWLYKLRNESISLQRPESKPSASATTCSLSFSIPTPTPTVSPTPTPATNCQVGGKKFEDINSDRRFTLPPDSYTNVTNWAFNLYKRNTDGTKTQVAQTTTANGSWLNWPNSFKFTNLDCSASYIIKEELKTGWKASGDYTEGVRDSSTTWTNPRLTEAEGSEAWFHFNNLGKIVVDTGDQYNGQIRDGFHFGNVKITPTATPTLSCKNLDIALVFDRSSTMNQTEADGRKKLVWAKDAAKGFVQAIINTGATTVKIGVASFGAQGNDGTGVLASGYNSTLNSPLIGNLPNVLTAINGVNYSLKGTCIECGLRIGNGLLTNTANRRVEILLSDGMANHNWDGSTSNSKVRAINMANAGRASGIEYRVLGYGQKSSNQIDENTLINIAGSPIFYQYKPDVSSWSSAFLTILQELCGGTPTTPTPIASLVPTADASVISGSTNATKNFGTATKLNVDGSPVKLTYFKFDLTPLAGKTIKSAFLKLNVLDSSSGDTKVKVSPTTWTETLINYNNRPAAGTLITSFKGGKSGFNTYVDLTEYVKNNKGQVVSFLIDSTNSDGLDFSSRESASKPTIIVY